MIDWKRLPKPSERRIALHVTPQAERAIRTGHPWLFSDSIRRQSHHGSPGDLAVLFDRNRRFLAIGLYDPSSPIKVRILQYGRPATINRDWFRVKLKEAFAVRGKLPAEGTNGFRLVHGENDGLPGLVIDRYANSLVVKLYTTAWVSFLSTLAPILQETINPERLILRLSRNVHNHLDPALELRDGTVLLGSPLTGPVKFQENGLTFEADLIRGQKTGFFLDQRDNRSKVEMMVARGSKIRHVLNIFAYTGGFSLYAARGGARSVLSLDSSRPALESAQRNFAHNHWHLSIAAAEHNIVVGDAFQKVQALGDSGRKFDMVIIDPPAFAKSKKEKGKALRAYSRIVKLGLAVLSEEGTIVAASCSSHVDAASFFSLVNQVARETGRPLVELARTDHPIDHPVNFPQGAYLKCLFAIAP